MYAFCKESCCHSIENLLTWQQDWSWSTADISSVLFYTYTGTSPATCDPDQPAIPWICIHGPAFGFCWCVQILMLKNMTQLVRVESELFGQIHFNKRNVNVACSPEWLALQISVSVVISLSISLLAVLCQGKRDRGWFGVSNAHVSIWCCWSRTVILSLLILFIHMRHSFKLTKETVCLRFFKWRQSFPSSTMVCIWQVNEESRDYQQL